MSEFNAFCKTPKAVIQKVAATVPLYEFTGPVGGNLVGADLDGNGKVDLISSDTIHVPYKYEEMKNHGDLKNGLWRPVSTITRQELIALREDCGDGSEHQTAKDVLMAGVYVSTAGAGVAFVGMAAMLPLSLIVGAAVVCGAGLLTLTGSGVYMQFNDAKAAGKFNSHMWRKTHVGAPL